mgnify:FL=1
MFMFMVAGCDLLDSGGEDSPQGITEDLSHLKGPNGEPDLSNLGFVDGRVILINSQISGTFGSIGNAHTFIFRSLDSQLVSISIKDKSGSREHIKVYVRDPALDDDESMVSPSTLTASTFPVTAGQTYEVSVFTDNGGSYTVTLADANRETMGLGSHEFYVSFVRTGERQCNGRTTTYQAANLNFIFNFRNASFLDNLNQPARLELIDQYTIGQSRSVSGKNNSSIKGSYEYTDTSNHWFSLNPTTGNVSGELSQERTTNYDDRNFETQACIFSTRFEGQIIL